MSDADEMNDSKQRNHQRAGSKKRPSGEYETGYCKPPKAHRFKTGQPRPPRKAKPQEKSLLTIFKEIVSEKVDVRMGDEVFPMKRGDAIIRANFNLALKGNKRAMHNVLAISKDAQLFQEPVRVGGTIAVPYPCQSAEEYEARAAIANEVSMKRYREMKEAEAAAAQRYRDAKKADLNE